MIASISNFISNDYKTLKASDSVLEVQEFLKKLLFRIFPFWIPVFIWAVWQKKMPKILILTKPCLNTDTL